MASADHTPLTAERLRALLHYEPEMGVFRWRVSRQGCRAGDIAGRAGFKGYWRIGIDKCRYYAHRLAYLYMIGVWPPHGIDHWDENKANNRWGNLRPATDAENKQNRRRANRGSVSGILGVHHYGGGCRSRIRVDGKTHCLGTFTTEEAADAAYKEAKERLHPFATFCEPAPSRRALPLLDR